MINSNKYEYLTKSCPIEELQDTLNKYGEYGYEMANILREGKEYLIVFKREN